MTDTAQPSVAAESDGLAEAANAFKAFTSDQPIVAPRDDKGRFASQAPAEAAEDEEIKGEDEGQPEAEPASDAETDEGEEAAEEAQPEAVAMPASWSKEDADTWSALPPEAQAKIAEREGQRDAAVNQKFQEAANVRKANEAVIAEANANRQRFADGLEQVMSLIDVRPPPPSLLDINSSDYDPDRYHLLRHQYETNLTWQQHLAGQRQQIAAQAQAEAAQQDSARFHAIESASRDKFITAVPDVTDQAKAPAIFQGLAQYALEQGAPSDMFEQPTTALEWHMLWKAREYDRLQTATAKVKTDPKPEPRKAQPAIRSGVTTPRSAVMRAARDKDFNRLATEGSIAAGAAAWKHFLK